MGRGVKVNISEYLEVLKPLLMVGCSLHEACIHSEIPYSTIWDYIKKDEGVRKKIEAWESNDILIARTSVVNGLTEDSNLALKYLERKKKDEFSLRTESKNETAVDLSLDKSVKQSVLSQLSDEELESIIQEAKTTDGSDS
jgi:hypothetical protein